MADLAADDDLGHAEVVVHPVDVRVHEPRDDDRVAANETQPGVSTSSPVR